MAVTINPSTNKERIAATVRKLDTGSLGQVSISV
jgi:hypothetical protein